MHVLELAAGGGWYTEILAPYLKESGDLIVAHFNPDLGGYYEKSRRRFEEKIKDKSTAYEHFATGGSARTST